MANDIRTRFDAKKGILGALLSDSGTTITFDEDPGFPTLDATQYVPLILDPGDGDLLEIAYLTAFTATETTGTILRARENTTGQEHASGATWVHGPTPVDFGSAHLYWSAEAADLIVDPMPSGDTLVDGLSITLPASSKARMAFVSADCEFTGGHTNRFDIYIDGSAIPGNRNRTANVAGGNNIYDTQFSQVPVAVPGDSASHTIEVRWNASDSLAAVTLKGRSITIMTVEGSASPLVV